MGERWTFGASSALGRILAGIVTVEEFVSRLVRRGRLGRSSVVFAVDVVSLVGSAEGITYFGSLLADWLGPSFRCDRMLLLLFFATGLFRASRRAVVL